jgi:hypothetical protein
MATNRHISCGAVELKELYWGKGVLSGKSELVANEIYKIYIHEPKGYTFSSFVCEGAEYHGDRKKGSIRVVSMKASKHEVVQWEAFYR